MSSKRSIYIWCIFSFSNKIEPYQSAYIISFRDRITFYIYLCSLVIFHLYRFCFLCFWHHKKKYETNMNFICNALFVRFTCFLSLALWRCFSWIRIKICHFLSCFFNKIKKFSLRLSDSFKQIWICI